MTDPRVHAQLAEPLRERFGMPLSDVEEQLYSAMAVGGALLPLVADRYRDLAARRHEHGSSDEIRRDALDAAGDLAAVLGVARRHQPQLAVLNDTALKTSHVFGSLEQIYDSLVLLTDPELTDETDVGLTDDDLAALLAIPDLQEWLEPKL